MIRVRFHGRGGQGVKTASRILGTAAFHSGFHIQDSPIYGAERRGAPVVAFTRIDRNPILERGVVDIPDLVLIADASLLDDRSANILGGTDVAIVFVNAKPTSDLTSEAIKLDLNQLTLERVGTLSAISTGLAAAAARLIGLIDLDALMAAIGEELSSLGATLHMVEQNLELAREVYSQLTPAILKEHPSTATGRMWPVGYDEPILGSPSIVASGNALQRHTGTWRLERPVIDYDVCTRCRLCVLGCPDGAMMLDAADFPKVDYDHCKGCMICARICPLHGIRRESERQAC